MQKSELILLGIVLLVAVTALFTSLPTEGSLGGNRTGMAATRYQSFVTWYKDIAYGNQMHQKMDVVSSRNFKMAPVVVLVHGGGWSEGDKQTMASYAGFFNKLGFVAVLPNYRLSSEGFTFPTEVNDVACAVVSFKRDANKYGANKDKIFILGHSAGSQIAAMLAYNSERDWLKECTIKNKKTIFMGFIGSSGVYDFDLIPKERDGLEPYLGALFGPENWNSAEPINFVDASDPPALLIHGDKDFYVNYQNSIDFAEALREKGVQVQLNIIPGYLHNDPLRKFPTDRALQSVVKNFVVSLTQITR